MAEDKFITANGVKLHYTVSGSGKPIILMHGWGCNTTTLASIEKIAEQTHTVYNVDFPGFGQSPEPPSVWGVEDYTRMIEDMVRQLGLDKPALLGHSFGGRVGILYASRNPVDRLILVDAAGVKPRHSLQYYIKVYSFKLTKFLIKLIYPKETAQRKIDELRSKRGSSDYNNASSKMKAILSKVVNEDLKGVMPKVQAPQTLLIWGENDTATPLSDAKTMEKLIPGAALVSFPGCGHYSFLDNPRQFAAVLKSFLTAEV